MARSRNRYSRAQLRARYRKPRRSGTSKWFYGAITLVVVAGVVGIVALRPTNAGVHPLPADPATGLPTDHWHAALGVDVCGEWLAPPDEFETPPGSFAKTGIHTHGDGYIHVHPFFRSESGNKATLGRFLANGGWTAAEDELTLWVGLAADPERIEWADGDRCPAGTEFEGRRGVVKWAVDCKVRSGDPSDYKIRDQDVIALAFLPRDEKIPVPPNAGDRPDVDQKGVTPEAASKRGCAPTQQGNPGQSPIATTTSVPGATTPSSSGSTTPTSTP